MNRVNGVANMGNGKPIWVVVETRDLLAPVASARTVHIKCVCINSIYRIYAEQVMYFIRRTRRRNFARRLECTRGRRSAQSADSAVRQQNPRAKRSTRRVETATSTSAPYLSQAIEIEIKMRHWYTLKFSRLNTDLIAQLERLKIEMFLKIWSQMNRLNNNLEFHLIYIIFRCQLVIFLKESLI